MRLRNHVVTDASSVLGRCYRGEHEVLWRERVTALKDLQPHHYYLMRIPDRATRRLANAQLCSEA